MIGFVGMLALTSLPGCSQEGESASFFVSANAYVARKTQCSVPKDANEFRPIGILDLMGTNRYWMFPVFENGMEETEKTVEQTNKTGHADAANIILKGAYVKFSIAGLKGPWWSWDEDADRFTATSALAQTWVPTSGNVKPAENETTMLEGLPANIGTILDQDAAFDEMYSAAYLTITMVGVGVLGDGKEIKTPEYQFSILVCRGCLVGYEVPPEACCSYVSKPSGLAPCFPGQDESFSCLMGCFLAQAMGNRPIEKQALLQGITDSLAEKPPDWFLKEVFDREYLLKHNDELPPADFDYAKAYKDYLEQQKPAK
jgi:hypothetical protein